MTRPVSLLAFVATLLMTEAARASCIFDISDHRIPITTGFAGSEVLLFGTVEEPSDVVVTLRGPLSSVVMFRKARVAGIWVNAASMTFEEAPSFFSIVASRPLEEIAAETELRLHQLGVRYVVDLPRSVGSPDVREAWKQAMLRNMAGSGLYPSNIGSVTFLGDTLFRARMQLPSNVPTGQYLASAYCLVDGKVQSAQTIPLFVEKTGVEAWIFDFAHDYPMLYGLIAVALALMAGWSAHLAFGRS
ncbi:MAG: TIGR02186 family protein [Kiloniellales bacterium]|nr:TIGR02186 family protein [Kiloniellales bacterium]